MIKKTLVQIIQILYKLLLRIQKAKILNNINGIFVIKSTGPIGATKNISQKRTDLKIIHNPEFLTARNSVEDFNSADRNIIGGYLEWAEILKTFYSEYFPHIPTTIVSSDESETIKYFSNTYLSVKVAYFNLLYDLCQKLGMNYDNVKDGIISDKKNWSITYISSWY